MSNIYVAACCNLAGYDPSCYKTMYEISKKTVEQNVKDIGNHVCITGSFDSAFDMFKHIFYETARLAINNNVFFVDVDMLCVKPVNVFGQHDQFCMFGGWDNAGFGVASYTEFEKYFSASPRYIPKSVGSWFYDNGSYAWEHSPKSELWDYEQVLYNRLIRKQEKFDVDKYFNMREYNYIVDERAKNQCNIKDALFLHFSGSRNPQATVSKMEEAYDRSFNPN